MTKGSRSPTTSYAASSRTRSSLFLALALVLVPVSAHAQIVISEFLYDAPGSDTGAEWIELHNIGAAPADLSKWKINDGSNHVLNVPPKNGGTGPMTLAAGGYMILASNASAFSASHGGATVAVIDTTLSLSNTAGTITLLDASSSSVDAVSYAKTQGAAGDGNSLQKTAAGAWISAKPTPGAVNSETAALPPAPVVKAAKPAVAKKVAIRSKAVVHAEATEDTDPVEIPADVSGDDTHVGTLPTSSAEVAGAAGSMSLTSPWFVGALGLSFAAAGAGWMARRSKKTEWDIEEIADDV